MKTRKKRSGYHRNFPSTVGREERAEITLARTKRLLLAALRVWELKNGIDPSFS